MSLVFPHTFVPWFRAVAPYIHAYRGKTFVVGLAGEAIAAGKLNTFVQDLSILHAMGLKLVLVHGFRPQVTEQLAAKGHVSRFHKGTRVTDAVALDAAQEAAGQLRFEIEAAFTLALAGYSYYLDSTVFALCIGLAAASSGFLVWNWPKAKIFMGDVGSGFLGLLLGVLILLAAQQAAVMLYCGLILFGIFIVDATYTLLVRMLSGQKWYDAHCSHTYQRAAKRYGHLPVLLACWLINLLWLLPLSFWVFLHPSHALAALLIAYVPLLFMAYRFKAGQKDSVNL